MPKFTPERMCVACRTSFPKNSLLRFVLDENDNLLFDENQKAQGRGVYLCKNESCIKKCLKTRAFSRALKKNLSEEAYTAVKEEYDRLQQT